MVEPLHDILRHINTGNKDGELELNRAMSVGELRKAIEHDSDNPDEVQDEHLSTVVRSLGTGYSCVIVTVFSENPPHIGIDDRHESSVRKATMELFQKLGYSMVDSGVKEYSYKDGNSYQYAFAEFRLKTEKA